MKTAELASMSWQEFESFSIEVLRKYYERTSRLEIKQTRLSGDGGRDGEAILVLAPAGNRYGLDSDESRLEVAIKVWVEVKQRAETLQLKDVGGHVLLAFLDGVTKLVFVTNADFSPQLSRTIKAIAASFRLQSALINGERLIRLAEQTSVGSLPQRTETPTQSTEPPSISLFWTLALESSCARAQSTPHRRRGYRVASGEPVFLIVELEVNKVPQPLRVAVKPSIGGSSTTGPLSLEEKSLTIGQFEHIRLTWPVWHEEPTTLDASDVQISVSAENSEKLEISSHCGAATVEVYHSILGTYLPDSRQLLYNTLCDEVNRWSVTGGFHSISLVASAGTGKSHLFRLLRKTWLEQADIEIHLDGELHKTDFDVFSSICSSILPDVDVRIGAAQKQSLMDLLEGSGFERGAADFLATWLCRGTSPSIERPSEALLGRTIGRLLEARVAAESIVLAFDDLHKISPSAIAVLTEALKEIKRRREGNFLFANTSRHHSSARESSTRILWRQQFNALQEALDLPETLIGTLAEPEATTLLRSIVPRLQRSYCKRILDRVGTTPFAIREVLLYLRQQRAIEWDISIEEFLPRNYTSTGKMLDLASLEKVTEERLRAVRDGLADVVIDILDAGACLGKAFRFAEAITPTSDVALSEIEVGLGELEAQEILRPSALGADWIEFDHDLIRRQVIKTASGVRRRRMAGLLLDALELKDRLHLKISLAYQAGRATRCIQLLEESAMEARRVRRFHEEAEMLGMAVTILEPGLSEDLMLGEERCVFDDAITYSVAPRLQEAEQLEVRRLLLDYLYRLALAAAHVGSGSNELVERSATEALMLAKKYHRPVETAALTGLLAKVDFERDRIGDALEKHRDAETQFSQLGEPPSQRMVKMRARNLIRMAIAEREMGDREDSRRHLNAAESMATDFPELRVSAITNLGASYFHQDWAKTRQGWETALQIAIEYGLIDREAHLLLDLGRLDILEGDSRSAESRLSRVSRLLEEIELEYPRMRFLNQKGVLSCVAANYELAESFFLDAEDYAVRNGATRRIWKFRSNLATVYEAQEDLAKAYAYDAMAYSDVFRLINEETPHRTYPHRAAMSLANMMLRQRGFSGYEGLLDNMNASIRTLVAPLAGFPESGTAEGIPFSLTRHLLRVGKVRRYLFP